MMVALLLVLFAVAMLAQVIFNLVSTLYVWWRPERLELIAGPKQLAAPAHRFSVLVPARHEEAVIGATLRQLAASAYPPDLLEVIVIVSADDLGTIAAATEAISDGELRKVRLVEFEGLPVNKPRALNVGLAHARHEIVVVADAEDDVSPRLFDVVNTILVQTEADVVQAGVALTDFHRRWYSAHNVLEYYFWFKSRMLMHASLGVVPLGGNTAFFRASQLRALGGWDEACLVEDAEIGIRLTAAGKRVHVTYEALDATREETPPSVRAFIKQRARWNQGFLQVLAKGEWRRYPRLSQRLLCGYLLTFPVFQALLLLASPALIGVGVALRMPEPVALLTWLPVLIVVVQLLISAAALLEFAAVHEPERGWTRRAGDVVRLGLTYLPYQGLLAAGALRAVWRQARRREEWEKTLHTGCHRLTRPAFQRASLSGLPVAAGSKRHAGNGRVALPDPAVAALASQSPNRQPNGAEYANAAAAIVLPHQQVATNGHRATAQVVESSNGHRRTDNGANGSRAPSVEADPDTFGRSSIGAAAAEIARARKNLPDIAAELERMRSLAQRIATVSHETVQLTAKAHDRCWQAKNGRSPRASVTARSFDPIAAEVVP